jgi:GT2 family glycosyltransferase
VTAFLPARVVEVELAEPLPPVAAVTPSGRGYRRALSLVRLHGRPLGLVSLELGTDGLTPAAYAEAIRQALAAEVAEHLAADGLDPATEISSAGMPRGDGMPPCLAERGRLLAFPPFISVIVATRDRAESLGRCLDSLLALDYPAFEVVVVDNAPASDATQRLVAGRAPRIRYIREDVPGLAAAHNAGLRAARGAIAAFTDDDVTVDRRWLGEIAASFARHEEAACVTGLIVPAELDAVTQAWMEALGRFGKGFARRVFTLEDGRSSPLHPYGAGSFGSGANMAFRTSFLREIGGFDPAMGAGASSRGGDDLAAFFRVLAAGKALVYEPAAVVWHRYEGEDLASLRRRAFGYGAGLTAYLTSVVVEEPVRLVDLVRLAPAGLRWSGGRTSPRRAAIELGYPSKLLWVERRGMAYGPLGYLWGRARRRKMYPSGVAVR